MAMRAAVTQDARTGVEIDAPALSDAANAAEAALVGAVSFAGRQMGLGRTEVAIALKQRERRTTGYFQYGLAEQVAAYLAALDENVKAVYVFDDEATPEDMNLGDSEASPVLHLIVWARRKTGALSSLIAALDRSLVTGYSGLAAMPQLAHLLDAQVIDDEDVTGRRGYAALLSSVHHQPLQVWKR
jgi:hypothetical protein